MYKIVNIADLNDASNFIESDKVIEITYDQTHMQIANNDYAHKNQSYLSSCVDIADNAFNAYLSAIDNINNTYFTKEIESVYLPNGSAIKQDTFDRIINSDSFLTKDACKQIETDCIAYIDELKNKAVSIIMAQLNNSFITQNSVGKLSYGQQVDYSKYSNGPSNIVEYKQDLLRFGPVTNDDYNFETGEFSLANLLFDQIDFSITTEDGATIGRLPDAWKDYYESLPKSYIDADTVDNMIKEIDTDVLFNAYTELSDYRIHVPSASFDYQTNKIIPIAKLVEYFLKKQIKIVIKRICDKYISQMTSIPKFVNISQNSSS